MCTRRTNTDREIMRGTSWTSRQLNICVDHILHFTRLHLKILTVEKTPVIMLELSFIFHAAPFTVTCVTSCLSTVPSQVIDMLPVVVVHGGAGHIPKERSEKSTTGVCSAVRAGYAVLQGGGSSMDAVVEAVTQLENNPSFNAGNITVLHF